MKPIRVLIVDDSPTVQSVLTSVLSDEPDIEVVGIASDPFEAKDLIMKKKPDVITLDIEMPRMDGITFLKRLMSFRPVPVIMISSYTRENSVRTFEALNAGALDFVSKPTGDIKTGLRKLKHEITTKLKSATQAKIKPFVLLGKSKKPVPIGENMASNKIIVIGASSGGTQAIQKLLEGMPSNINGIVIVQHMPARFTNAFAKRLNELFPMKIKEAEDGDRIDRGYVLVAPGGCHLEVAKDPMGYYIQLKDGRPVKHQRPSIDIMFHSVAKTATSDGIGIILTGMGDDGADGLLAMKQAGAFTVAQDEASSVIFGMPKAAIERGAATVVAALDDIASAVISSLKI